MAAELAGRAGAGAQDRWLSLSAHPHVREAQHAPPLPSPPSPPPHPAPTTPYPTHPPLPVMRRCASGTMSARAAGGSASPDSAPNSRSRSAASAAFSPV